MNMNMHIVLVHEEFFGFVYTSRQLGTGDNRGSSEEEQDLERRGRGKGKEMRIR